MATRWDRYYKRQLEDPEMKKLVEQELAALNIGVQIARLRAERHLTQTQLAAKAGMSAPKISAIESSTKNVELATALECQFKSEFIPTKATRRERLRAARSAV